MPIRKITAENIETSRWAGGETRQLYIHPPQARYADRDFDFRLSTATVELEASDFTPLPGYLRLLAPVEGTLTLRFGEAHPEVTLDPLEVCRFEGGWPTRSLGRARDFNLMLRRGVCSGTVMGAQLAPGSRLALPVGFPAPFARLVWCADGGLAVASAAGAAGLGPGELAVLTGDACIRPVWAAQSGSGPARLMAADVTYNQNA